MPLVCLTVAYCASIKSFLHSCYLVHNNNSVYIWFLLHMQLCFPGLKWVTWFITFMLFLYFAWSNDTALVSESLKAYFSLSSALSPCTVNYQIYGVLDNGRTFDLWYSRAIFFSSYTWDPLFFFFGWLLFNICWRCVYLIFDFDAKLCFFRWWSHISGFKLLMVHSSK